MDDDGEGHSLTRLYVTSCLHGTRVYVSSGFMAGGPFCSRLCSSGMDEYRSRLCWDTCWNDMVTAGGGDGVVEKWELTGTNSCKESVGRMFLLCPVGS